LFFERITLIKPTAHIKGLKIRLRGATIEILDEFQKTLEALKSAPSVNQGYVEILAPLEGSREGYWRLNGHFGIDTAIQKAIKANRSVELIEEVAA